MLRWRRLVTFKASASRSDWLSSLLSVAFGRRQGSVKAIGCGGRSTPVCALVAAGPCYMQEKPTSISRGAKLSKRLCLDSALDSKSTQFGVRMRVQRAVQPSSGDLLC